jgi:hypothetical protein
VQSEDSATMVETQILDQPQTSGHEHVHDHVNVNVDVHVSVVVIGCFLTLVPRTAGPFGFSPSSHSESRLSLSPT